MKDWIVDFIGAIALFATGYALFWLAALFGG